MSIDPKRSQVVFQKLERDLIKLSSKLRPDTVHRFRTHTRRLQILLSELSPKLDRNQKKLLKLLSRIRKRAGKLRDLDVQLVALRSLKVPREPRRKTQLVNHLIELRGEQDKKLRKAVDDGTVREIRKRLKRASRNFSPEASQDPLVLAKKMIAGISGLEAPLSEVLLHQYRIVTKRARYAAEFAAPSAEATQIMAGLKRIQDALGDWHDWFTLTQTASEHLGEVRDSSLVSELHNVAGAKFRHAVSVLLHARAKLVPAVEHPARSAAGVSVRITRPTAAAAAA